MMAKKILYIKSPDSHDLMSVESSVVNEIAILKNMEKERSKKIRTYKQCLSKIFSAGVLKNVLIFLSFFSSSFYQ